MIAFGGAMSDTLVHYELFIRRRGGSPWVLDLATESRALAMETADTLMANGEAIAVRVMKEALDPETREFRSIKLFEKGETSPAKAKVKVVETPPLCVEARDLYNVHAREVIGRLLSQWLRRKTVTPFELLHRADLLESLESSGMEMQHAIQKIAVPEAQERGESTHEVMRRYQKITEQGIERVLRDSRRKAFPNITGANFGDVSRKMKTAPDGAYYLGGGLASYLAEGKTWTRKLELLLDLCDPASTDNVDFPFELVSQPLSELISARTTLVEISGVDQDLGADLALLTQLIAPDHVLLLTRVEPALCETFPRLSGQTERLAVHLKNPGFLDVRAALARRILHELNGPRRLRPSDAQGEIVVLRALAMVLTSFAGKIMPPDDVQAAFVKRSGTLVSSEFVDSYLAEAPTALAEAYSLIRLGENVVGAANKRAVGKWIAATVSALKFETEMRSGPGQAGSKLTNLAELQQSLKRVSLLDADKAYIADKLGAIGGLIEADSRYVSNIAKASIPALSRLTALVRLASGETAPLGPVTALAKQELQKMLRAPDLRAELAQTPEILDLVRDLLVAA